MLAASIFHRRECSIAEVKAAMAAAGLPVRVIAHGSSPREREFEPPGPVDLTAGSIAARSPGAPDGLVAGVVQDVADGRVLMVGWLDAEALAATLATGEVHFHSRSRGRLWRKGETLGQRPAPAVARARLRRGRAPARRRAHGADLPPRHTLAASTRTDRPAASPTPQGFAWLESLWATIAVRAAERPAGSYTVTLLDGGVDLAGRKVAEEATEVLLAAKNDEAAEATGADRTETGRCSPARPPTSCTTRSCCWPSGASTPRRHRGPPRPPRRREPQPATRQPPGSNAKHVARPAMPSHPPHDQLDGP